MLKQHARDLRRTMTDPERALWSKLRNSSLGFKFRRQLPIGRYIVDFACEQRRLIIELDGSQHVDCSRDRVRDEWLAAQGYQVLRFWNTDVVWNMEGVLMEIGEQAANRPLYTRRETPDGVWPGGGR
jgi:very-short-patch-repair endonuclease